MESRQKIELSLPQFILVAGTRALIGAGLSLLVADRLKPEQKKAIGWTLFGVGLLSTIPLGLDIFRGKRFFGRRKDANVANSEYHPQMI